MRLEDYLKLKNDIHDFDKDYIFTMWADEVKMAGISQQRASGHNYHKIPEMMRDLEQNGQFSPISVTRKGGNVKVEDGNTRLIAKLRIQQETGERQMIICSDYSHRQGLDENDWIEKRFTSNEHLTSSPNTLEDFEKTVSQLYNNGQYDKLLKMTHFSDPEKYREGMILLVKERLRPRLTEKKIEKVVDKVINFQGYTPNFWSYDTHAAIEAVNKSLNFNWKGKSQGKSDRGISTWVASSTSQIEKDQLSYAYRRRVTKPEDKRVLVLYVKNLTGKGEEYIVEERKKLLTAVKKWNYDGDRCLWDEVYFLPQIKRKEDKYNLMKVSLDMGQEIQYISDSWSEDLPTCFSQ